MQQVRIIVVSKDDPPAFPEAKLAIPLELTDVVIVQGGMQSGRASVGLVFMESDGKFRFAEMSAAMFENLAAGVRGAALRFGEVI